MSETLHEQLSALLDGELAPAETELLLKRLSRDPSLRQQMSRYSLIGDAIRMTADRSQVSAGFAARISTAIERETGEPAVTREPQPAAGSAAASLAPANHWWRSVGGFAVAATVAGLAVLVMQRPDATLSGQVPVAAAIVAPQPAAQVAAAGSAGTPAVSLTATDYALDDLPPSYVTPEASGAAMQIPPAQLANYVIAHSEFGSPFVRRNVITGLVAQDPMQEPSVEPGVTAAGRVPVDAVVEGAEPTP